MLIWAKNEVASGQRFIELGCATGKQTFQAEELGATVVGLDYVPEALRIAHSIAEDIGSRASFLQANYFTVPFAPTSFDVVLFHKNLVEINYNEADRLACEIARILKPGGELILTPPDSIENTCGHPTRRSTSLATIFHQDLSQECLSSQAKASLRGFHTSGPVPLRSMCSAGNFDTSVPSRLKIISI